MDLFAWATSSYHKSTDTYNTNYQPYSHSQDVVNTTYNCYGYGPSQNQPVLNLTGTSANYDWGVYNAISNGGNTPGLWRTMTISEWDYLLNTRTTTTLGSTANARYAKATVNGITGMILFPDNYMAPGGVAVPQNINQANAEYSGNIYTIAQWLPMEKAGCVFLPSTEHRGDTEVDNVNTNGGYWSVSNSNNQRADRMDFSVSAVSVEYHTSKCNGYGVRLVKNQ